MKPTAPASTRTVVYCTLLILIGIYVDISLSWGNPAVLPPRYRNSIPTDDIQQPWKEPTPLPGNRNRV
jgi:hypothetical protein